MTSFQETTNAAADTAAETKPEEIKVEPKSRVKDSPGLWAEACEFANMLAYRRPHQSKTERQFIAKYLVPIDVKFDKFGNAYKIVGKNPNVLWSSHTDTVHSTKGFQKIEYYHRQTDGNVFFQVADVDKKSTCLGADDTTGVWLMLEMIKANVPGLYVFHRGEEVGRKGSKWIADNNKAALKDIRFAIAFDRRGDKSIITHQMSMRCCSDEFANSLSGQLGMGHETDTTGSYTDTASYVDLVAECTNVSTGYESAHCKSEHTNIDYLFNLRDALCKIDVSKLVEKRKAGDNTRLYSSWSSEDYYSGSYGGWWGYAYGKDKKTTTRSGRGYTGFDLRKKHDKYNWMDDYEYDRESGLWFEKEKTKNGNENPHEDTLSTMSHVSAVRLIRLNPESILDLLESLGCGPKEIKNHLLETTSGRTVFL